MKRAIFFDLDGTLWDGLESISIAWSIECEKQHYPYRFTPLDVKSHMGLTPSETVPIAFPGLSFEDGIKLFNDCVKKEIEYMSNKPGTLYENEKEVLDRLKDKYDLYIVSNCNSGYIENYISSCHMEKYFKGHLCVGDTGKDKWENILILKEREGVDSLIYVGDTKKDMVESAKANVPFIHAAYGFGEIKENCYKINSLNELEEVAEKIFKD